jgi:hypothetical protein
MMGKTTNPKTSNSKLSLKKDTLRHLKVRTNLKGGVAVAAVARACATYHCPDAQLGGAVINPAPFGR